MPSYNELTEVMNRRQAAVDMAIRIKSMQPNMPLVVNMDAIPTETGINVSKWLDIVQNQRIALVREKEESIVPLSIVEEILNNAQKIENFIKDGTTGNE